MNFPDLPTLAHGICVIIENKFRNGEALTTAEAEIYDVCREYSVESVEFRHAMLNNLELSS